MAVVAGVADTPVGVVPDLNATELYAVAIRGAVADAGAAVGDIDFLITGNSREHQFLYHAEMVAEYMGIRQVPCSTALVDTTGGINSSHATLILGREG